MAKVEQRTRIYDKPDDVMLEQAQTMCDLFTDDKADFIAMYTGLADPFAADFQTHIDSAQALRTADEEILQLEVLTEEVDAQMELAKAQFQKMASYVKLLFPNSAAKQGLFGLGKYIKVYKSQTKMYDLLQLTFEMADSITYKADLIALGFTQIEIDKLESIAEDLYNANKAQEKYKQTIKIKTEERVETYNTVWADMKAISSASKQVYVDDYTKLRLYLLYPEGESGLGKPQNLLATYNPLDPPDITLSWDDVTGATSYNIYYDNVGLGAPAGDFSLLNNVPSSPATIPGVIDRRFYFKIKAKNDKQTSVYSDEVYVDVAVS